MPMSAEEIEQMIKEAILMLKYVLMICAVMASDHYAAFITSAAFAGEDTGATAPNGV